MSNIVAIIPARGGSKGIPRKNLLNLCGKPLVAWSILQARNARAISSVWVSSDDEETLAIAESLGANRIQRPAKISGDDATSESAWLHAIDTIEEQGIKIDQVVAIQATSPLRESTDLDEGIRKFNNHGFDSLFSATTIEDYFVWKVSETGIVTTVNHDFRNRKRRQEIEKQYLENGSFYIFRPEVIRRNNNRLGGKIGFTLMDRYKMYQIDNPEDVEICSALMIRFGLNRI